MDRGSNVNMYGASPFPRATLGYAASTANDISLEAFAHLEELVAAMPADGLHDARLYAAGLDDLRRRLRRCLGTEHDVDIVFAPSGTDLEYVPIALLGTAAPGGITNILLGPDEVGSGCALAAAGRFFARETAVRHEVPYAGSVPGLNGIDVVGVPIRDKAGVPVSAPEIAAAMEAIARASLEQGRKVVAHIVHGSKTGLVLPDFAGIDALRSAFGEDITFVVDACQVRLEFSTIREYLARDCVVLLTGSKFVGGPPFSGFALVPPSLRPKAHFPAGLSSVFSRAEWPSNWANCDGLGESANPGLFLRLAAAVFEIERFSRIGDSDRHRVVQEFGRAVRELGNRLGVALVSPSLGGHGLHCSTLATLDLTSLPGNPDIIVAQRWQRVLAARGMRLGQPVRCVRTASGDWGANLRISLSMPLIGEFAQLDRGALRQRLDHDMARIAAVLEAARLPAAAA